MATGRVTVGTRGSLGGGYLGVSPEISPNPLAVEHKAGTDLLKRQVFRLEVTSNRLQEMNSFPFLTQ